MSSAELGFAMNLSSAAKAEMTTMHCRTLPFLFFLGFDHIAIQLVILSLSCRIGQVK